ncbi:MAG TPA: Nif3-like dinuclear metal center hexameric protein [Puia sp.]|nr:Nif3-like dinuclear metal center hexameric protein [Puia sp.]
MYLYLMKIRDVVTHLESLAPPPYQEGYDNAGLLTGSANTECSGVLVSLDVTPGVVSEAVTKKCNLVVAHHPIIFKGLKRLNGKNYVEKTVIAAIKNDVAIYAIHTNLDNVPNGVNGKIADRLGLVNRKVLLPKPSTLKKLYTFVPPADLEKVRSAVFIAGAGSIGDYSEAAFSSPGEGCFKAEQGANPYVGEIGTRHYEKEVRFETVFPSHLQEHVVSALRKAHPYQEVAFDVVDMANANELVGSGLIGKLPGPIEEREFLVQVRDAFHVPVIRHSAILHKPVRLVALCGGAGIFLLARAMELGADAFLTADIKYHEFFDAEDRILLADIGHFESEQFTIDLLVEKLLEKFTTFAVLKTEISTNPVNYFV